MDRIIPGTFLRTLQRRSTQGAVVASRPRLYATLQHRTNKACVVDQTARFKCGEINQTQSLLILIQPFLKGATAISGKQDICFIDETYVLHCIYVTFWRARAIGSI